jgi:putative MFS transporter
MTEAAVGTSAALLARLEALPFSPWHRRLLVIAGLGVFFDATDFAIFGSALPSISREFHLDPQQAGLLASIGLAGATVGALMWGTVSDYIGRRTAFQATIGLFAICTGLIGLAGSAVSLAVARFLANVGLGGEVPVATTLIAEFMPRSVRGRATNGALAAFPIGQVAAALLGLLVVPNLGWRSLFLIGTLPLLLLFLVRRTVPESVRYLLSRGRAGEAERTIDAIERSSGVAAPSAGPVPAALPKGPTGVSILKLLSPQLWRRTVLLWIVSVGNLWAANGMVFMLPTILTQRGLTLTNALTFTLLQVSFGCLGYFVCAFAIDRFGRRPVLTAYFVVGAALHLWFALATGAWMYVAIAAVGFVNPGVFGGAAVYAAELYPTAVRATAVGWFFGVGRVGSFLGPLIIGTMLKAGLGAYTILTFAVAFLIAGLALAAVGIETRGQPLDENAG